ncbi:hypothetical protein Tco_0341601, partial [Tanacetum coccineum]
LEQKKRSRTHRLKRLYKVGLTARIESFEDEEDLGEDASKHGRINVVDVDEYITLVSTYFDADTDMFGVHDLVGDEVVVETLTELKSAKPKADKVVIQEPEHGTTTTTPTTIILVPKPPRDKGKGIMIEEPVVEQVKLMKRLEQMRLDEQLAFKLQAEEEEEERIAKEKAQQIKEANIAWDDVQAKVEADYQLAQRLQAQEQEELTDEEKARLFIQFLEQRRKHFVDKRAEDKRNIPATRAQQRNIMCNYLKNMEGWKPKIGGREFQEDRNRAGTELKQEVTKKQKVDDFQETAEVDDVQETTEVDDDQEEAKIKEFMEIVPDEEEVAIDAILLATKPPTIIEWKNHK